MNEVFSTRRVAIGLAALLVLAYAGPALGFTSFFYRDFGALAYPTASYHREMFWRGELPLWNPYSNCGAPFLAQWGTMVLYPFSLIYCALPFPWSLNFFCLLHLWWGALGAFRLADQWTGSKAGAAVTAVLFLFNGLTLSSLAWPNYTVAFGWMPWIVLFAGRLTRQGGWWSIALAAAAGTMQMLSGVPELIFLTWLFVAAIWVMEAVESPALWKNLLRRGTAVVLLITALSAVQLLPFFEMLSLSQRQAGVVATKWALPSTALGNFLLPMLHAEQMPEGTWLQHQQQFVSSTYLGGTAVLLAVFGAIASGGRRTGLLAVSCFLCVLFALGGLWQKLPLVGLARYPVKFALLLPLPVSLLAAFGIRAISEGKVSRKDLLSAAGVMLAVCGGLIYWTSSHPLRFDDARQTLLNSLVRLAFFGAAIRLIYMWMSNRRAVYLVLLLGIFCVDGRWHLRNQNPTTSMQTLKAAIGSRALPKLGEGRVFISREAENAFLYSALRDIDKSFIGKQLAVWSHLNLVELAPKVNGSATLQIREQKEVQDWLYSGTNVNMEAWLDFLGVTHITAPGNVVEFTNRTSALPFLQAARKVTVADRGSKAEAVFGIDPRKETVLAWGSEGPLSAAAFKIHDVQVRPNEITAGVSAATNGLLVIAQSWHPAWVGESTQKTEGKFASARLEPLLRANYAFQAMPVAAGEGSVRIRYRDKKFTGGMAVSLPTVLMLLAPLAFGRRRSG